MCRCAFFETVPGHAHTIEKIYFRFRIFYISKWNYCRVTGPQNKIFIKNQLTLMLTLLGGCDGSSWWLRGCGTVLALRCGVSEDVVALRCGVSEDVVALRCGGFRGCGRALRWRQCITKKISVLYTLGWVDIGTSTWVPLECIHFYVKVPKIVIKSVLVKW
jgi:hypothetical protein